MRGADVRAIIFDLDDTLYPRDHFVFSGFAAVARHCEQRWGVSALSAFSTLCGARVAGRAGSEFQALCEDSDVPPDAVGELLHVFRTHEPDLSLPQSSRSALEGLRRDGWRIGVLTNGTPDVQARKVAALGLPHLVDEVVYATDCVDGGKPAPGAFRAALARLDVPASRAVCVGDDLRCDVYGARAAGLATIRVRRPEGVPQLADDADAVIESLGEIPVLAASLLAGDRAHVA